MSVGNVVVVTVALVVGEAILSSMVNNYCNNRLDSAVDI